MEDELTVFDSNHSWSCSCAGAYGVQKVLLLE